MDLIDSHCHLKGFKDKGELNIILDRAQAAGIKRFITVGTSPADWVTYRELHRQMTGLIAYTVGLHPCYVNADWATSVSQLSTFFMPPFAPCALGEIGLDYYHLPKDPIKAGESILLQEAAFRQQLMLAAELDCPIIIHCREAYTDCMKLIDESGIAWSRIVFHCFTYGPKEVESIHKRGGRASFTGIATYKSAKNVRDALLKQGIERLMLETDCPYLAPVPHRGEQNEPAYLRDIAECCAQNLSVPLEELAERTTANTLNFFNLN